MAACRYDRNAAQDDAGGSCSSCLQQVLFIFLALIPIVVLLGTASGGSSTARALDMGGCQVSERYPEKVRRWCDLITHHAQASNLHPDLVAALIWQESGGNERAYSHSGAVGLMQVMPRDGLAASFRCKGKPCFQDRPTMRELQDPEFNVKYGTRMLQGLVKKYNGSLRDALKAYGPMDVGYYYADLVLGIYKKYGNHY